MVLLMVAGIDTTWSAIGSSLWHLAQHPEDRRRLVAEDFTFEGCPFKEGDWVLLPFPAANRDPEVFSDADRVVLDRAENRHAAFGLGIHRCLGSNLARLELRVALEEWLARFPEFELVDPEAVTWSKGQVRGPRSVAVRILR
jgi:cytochrome P450